MDMELTPWHGGSVKPVHVGVYERQLRDVRNKVYSKWDGKKWHWICSTLNNAQSDPAISTFQRLPWRGLAKNPKD